MSRQTVDAFVLSWSSKLNAYFAYCNDISRDVIINKRFVSPDVDILGRWIRAVIRDHNSVCEHVIIIDDLYESRIFDDRPEIRVRVSHDGRFENTFEMFYHNYFGYICDTLNVIQDIESDRLYHVWINRLHNPRINSRWKISDRQRSVRPDEILNARSHLRSLEAVVHSLSLDGNSYFAWSKEEPRSKIVIDLSLCDSSRDLIGIWINVEVDNNNIAQYSPIIVQDVFATRSRYGRMEIRIDFESGTSGMFYNSYFGNISDPGKIVPSQEVDVWFEGWITFYIKHGVDSRWKISKDQVVGGPYNKIPNARSISNLPNIRETPPEYLNRRDQNNSPDIRNEYNNHFKRKHLRRFSRSPSPQNMNFRYFDDDRGRNYSNDSHQSVRNPDNSNERNRVFYDNYHDNNTFENERSFKNRSAANEESNHFENNSNSTSPKKENNSNQMNNEIPPVLYDTQQTFSERQGFESIRTPVDNTRRSERGMSESEYYTCSENDDEREGGRISRHHRENSTLRRDGSSPPKNDETLKKPPISSKTSLKPSGFSNLPESNETKPISKPEKTEEDRELLRLKSKLTQVSNLIESLTKDEYVSNQMKCLNSKEYEELMSLIKP